MSSTEESLSEWESDDVEDQNSQDELKCIEGVRLWPRATKKYTR